MHKYIFLRRLNQPATLVAIADIPQDCGEVKARLGKTQEESSKFPTMIVVLKSVKLRTPFIRLVCYSPETTDILSAGLVYTARRVIEQVREHPIQPDKLR